MSHSALTPRLASEVQVRSIGERRVLQHRHHRTQLELSADLHRVMDELDGEHTLEELEQQMIRESGAMAYQDLVMLLFQLWDRGMLANGDEIRDALFPNHKKRTLDRAQAWRRIRGLMSWSVSIPAVQRVLSALGGLGDVLSSQMVLGAEVMLTVIGIGVYFMGVAPLPDTLFLFHGSMFEAAALLYLSAAFFLTLRGLGRGAILAGKGGGVPTAGLQCTAGVFHLDVADKVVFHMDRDLQLRFAIASILIPAAAAGFMSLLGVRFVEPWLHDVALIGYIVAFLDLCPFLPTSGARVLELLSLVKKQRFRVRSFIGRRLIRGLFTELDLSGDETSFRIVATVWVVWFFGALKIFAMVVLSHIVGLQVAVIASTNSVEQAAGSVLFVYFFGLSVLLILTVGGVCINMFLQLVTPERAHPPAASVQGQSLDDTQRVALSSGLLELPLFLETDPALIDAIIDRAEQLHFHAADWIARAGSGEPRFFWIQSGYVDLLKPSTEGTHELVATLGPGDHFGEENLRSLPFPFDSQAVGTVQVLVLEGDSVVDLLSSGDRGGERTHAVLELASFLDSVPELAGLGASGRLSLTRDLRSRSVAEGEDIVREGDAADSLFLIRSGTCVVWRGEGGPEGPVLAELSTGQPFGEIGLMFRTSRTANVTAKEACELVEVSRAALEKALKRSFHVGLALESLAVRRLRGIG